MTFTRTFIGSMGLGALLSGIALATMPEANAGCQSTYVLGGYRSTCDGPIRTDGSWDRCDGGGYGYFGGTSSCFPMGGPFGVPGGQQPGHIYP